MFGMGFTEILIIGVIAILFLGPDKLPEAMVEIAKLLKNLKQTITSAKDSIESELHVAEMRDEMMSYKNELTSTTGKLTSLGDLQSEIDDIKKKVTTDVIGDIPPTSASTEPEEVTFKKKKEKTDISDTDV